MLRDSSYGSSFNGWPLSFGVWLSFQSVTARLEVIGDFSPALVLLDDTAVNCRPLKENSAGDLPNDSYAN
jgi:hypothetical protein